MALTERIITVYNDKGSKQAVKDIKSLEKKFSEAGKKITKAFLAATAAAGALAIKIGKDAVEAAMADQKSQVLLATALRNTTGATDAAIAASEAYITSLQMQLGVADDELRPALATLATASGDLAQAQTLLGLALDVSAGSGQSLESVSRALAKAQNGNFTALSRMFPALDKNAIASGDLVAITKELAGIYGGAAQDNANTFAVQLDRLKLAFGEILENIGYRLIPVLEGLVRIINEKVIPAIELWLENNGEKLAGVFEKSIGYVVAFFQSLIDTFSFVARNAKVFSQLGAVIIAAFAGAKIAMAVAALIKGIKAIITVMKTLRTVSLATAAANALATGGISAAAGAAAFATALIGLNVAMNKFNSDADKASDALGKFDFGSLTVNANDYTKGLAKLTVAQGKNTKAAKAAAAAAELELKTKKALAALAKLGVTPTNEKDPIQLEAARLNLIRQGNIAESERIKAIMDALEAQMRLNQAAERYVDLLQVLSDTRITDQEVAVLAQKWEMTKGQVLEYIARIYAANSTEVDDGPVIQLLMAWGLTKAEAEKYVDFTRALKDEKIDDKEIEELMGKWGMTRAQVLAYAKQVQDGTVFSGTWDDPGRAAEQSWIDALAALNAYLAKLGSGAVTPGGASSGGVTGGGAVTGGGSTGGTTGGATTGGATTGGTTVPSTFDPGAVIQSVVEGIPDAFKNTSLASTANVLSTARYTAQLNSIMAGFAATNQLATDRLNAQLQSIQAANAVTNQLASDRYTAMQNFYANRGTSGSTVNVTVQGSVVTETDLTNKIVNGIYQSQKSGQNIVYNAVAI